MKTLTVLALIVAECSSLMLAVGCSSNPPPPSMSDIAIYQAECSPRKFVASIFEDGSVQAACGGYCCDDQGCDRLLTPEMADGGCAH